MSENLRIKHQTGIIICATSFLLAGNVSADLAGPETEAVYGGRVSAMDVLTVTSTQSRVFVATESANSLFYTDVDHNSSPSSVSAFQTIPDVDADDNFGAGINELAVDDSSGCLFFVHNTGLYQVKTSTSSLANITTANVSAVEAYAGQLFYISVGSLHYGSIDSISGTFTENSDSPMTLSAGAGSGMFDLQIGSNGTDEVLYLFESESSTPLYICSDAFDSMNSGSYFSSITTAGLSVPEDYRALGIGPDGRIFMGSVIGAEPNHEKGIAWLDTSRLTWTEFSTGISGTSGSEIRCGSDPAGYYVYYGTAMSDNKGASDSWMSIGHSGFVTHPNDGAVLVDPLDNSCIYMTTDQGVGSSENFGAVIGEIDEGLEAVCVDDLEMDSNKNTAWVSSKSGIRKVSNYQASPSWSSAIYPMGDGSPFHSIAMDTTDHSGNTVFAGNSRVYSSTTGGSLWNRCLDATLAPWNLDFFSWVAALEVDAYNPDRIAAGYYSQAEDMKGQLFISEDGGSTFDIIQSGPIPADGADYNDVLFVNEGDSSSTIYAAVDYTYTMGFGTSYAVYRIEGSISAGWSVTQDMTFAVNIKDLAQDSSGGIYACGSDLGGHPVAYYKASGSTTWVVLGSRGLPGDGVASAICAGDDGLGNEIPYLAVDEGVYYMNHGTTAWTSGHEYPLGTKINVLYYDDLLVGTGTGLYGHRTMFSTTEPTAVSCGQDCGEFADLAEFIAFPPAVICVDEDMNPLQLRWYKNGTLICETDIESDECQELCIDGSDWQDEDFTIWYELNDGINIVNSQGENCSWIIRSSGVVNSNEPENYELGQNYPNPFNPSTTISFSLPAAAEVQLRIFNLSGQLVDTLIEAQLSAGKQEVVWHSGNKPSGVYFYRLESQFGQKVQKMTLLR
jgi:hypothetical protein